MLKKVCNFLMGIINSLLAIIAALLIVPTVIGCQNMAVLSGSMEPDIPVGSVVVVREVSPESLQIGDVVTYKISDDTNVTHRIVKMDEANSRIITKGDANDTEDGSPVSYDNILGKMWFHIPWLGYISIYIKTPLGIAGVCIIAAIIILLNYLSIWREQV